MLPRSTTPDIRYKFNKVPVSDTNMGRIGTKAALDSGDNIRFTYVYICQ